MRRDAGRVGLDQADDKVGVVDGSEWIKNQIARQSLPLDDLGLDFYHLAENIHKAWRVVFGEEDPKDEKALGYVWPARCCMRPSTRGTRNCGTNCRRGKRPCGVRSTARRRSKS